MGDMADMALEALWWGHDADCCPDDAPLPTFTSCRCCGSSGLSWRMTDKGWRLFAGKEMHACPVNPLKEGRP